MSSYSSFTEPADLAQGVDEQVIISTNKFIFLSLFTFGLYSVWWQYKAWRFFKQWQNSDIWPAFRALFSIFNLYQLLKEIERFAGRYSIPVNYGAGNMAAGYIILSLLSRVSYPIGLVSIGAPGFLVAPYNVFTIALLASNEVQAVEQRGFNRRQIALLVVFGLLWGLAIVGIFLPEDGSNS